MSASAIAIEREILAVFGDYVDAFNARDAARTAAHISVPCFDLAYADGAARQRIFESEEEVTMFFRAQLDRLLGLGWKGTSRVLRTKITPLSPATASILAEYERRTVGGEHIEEGRVVYYLFERDGVWKISGYVHVSPGFEPGFAASPSFG